MKETAPVETPRGVVDRGMLRTQRREVDPAAPAAFKRLREFPGRVVNTLERIVRGRHHIAVQGGHVVRVADRMQNSPSRHHAEVRQQPAKLCLPTPCGAPALPPPQCPGTRAATSGLADAPVPSHQRHAAHTSRGRCAPETHRSQRLAGFRDAGVVPRARSSLCGS